MSTNKIYCIEVIGEYFKKKYTGNYSQKTKKTGIPIHLFYHICICVHIHINHQHTKPYIKIRRKCNYITFLQDEY